MVEKEIREWIEEQLKLGEDPEILRKTLAEIDVDQKDIDSLVPENLVLNKSQPQKPKKGGILGLGLINKILPDVKKPPIPKEIKKEEPKKPTQKGISLPPKPVEARKEDVSAPQKPIAPPVSSENKKVGNAKLEALPAPKNLQEPKADTTDESGSGAIATVIAGIIIFFSSVFGAIGSVFKAFKRLLGPFGKIFESKVVVIGILLLVVLYIALFGFNMYVDSQVVPLV
ncbi:MAG: hypothetical protein KAT91_02950 [Candidatus Aenigmarchaeota archaeon]|nr:hypothetical protein [Candidatus Aenigmarchaeota archaeon]